MTDSPRLSTVNLSASDPARLTRFYQRLLGWPITAEKTGLGAVEDA